jgi:hypothetical protein
MLCRRRVSGLQQEDVPGWDGFVGLGRLVIVSLSEPQQKRLCEGWDRSEEDI